MYAFIFLCLLLNSYEAEGKTQKSYMGRFIRKRITENFSNSYFLRAILAVMNSSPKLQEIHLVNSHLCLGNSNIFQVGKKSFISFKIYDKFVASVEGVQDLMECSSELCSIVLCSSDLAIQVFDLVKRKSLESRKVHWFLLLNFNHTSNISEIRKSIREGSMVTLIHKMGDDIYFLLTSRVGADNIPWFKKIGILNISDATTSVISSKEPLFPDLKNLCSDFNGRELVITANNFYPSFSWETMSDGRIGREKGFDFSIMRVFAEKLNFRFIVKSPPDGKWGKPEEDGTVSGLIGMVARRDAYAAINIITINAVRDTVVDFTMPYVYDSHHLVSKLPEKKNEHFIVFYSFSLLIWGIIACLVVIVGLLANFFLRVSHNATDINCTAFSLQNAIFQVFSSLVVKDAKLPLNSLSSKVLMGFWFIFCLIIWSIYSGTLVALFAVTRYEKPIDSLEDLVKSGKHIPVVYAGTTEEYYFTEATTGIGHEVAKLLDPKRSFVTSEVDGLRKVYDGNGTFVKSQGFINQNSVIKEAGFPSNVFYFGRSHYDPSGYGVVLQSGCLCLEKFDEMILEMAASGLDKKWIEREIDLQGESKPRRKKAEPDAISLVNMQGAFYLLIIGLSVSCICFLAEIIIKRWNHN